MSTLIERISQDLTVAMKARDAVRVGALRMVRAAFIEAQKAGKGEVTDEMALDILRRMKKQREESSQVFTAGGRDDLAQNELNEIAVIDEYLPKLADEATTRGWVREAIAASGATNRKEMGKVMGALMKAHKADVDGALARKLIEEELPA